MGDFIQKTELGYKGKIKARPALTCQLEAEWISAPH